MADPTSPASEWVELYNPDNIDLSNYWIDDDTSFTEDSGSSTKKILTTIINNNQTYPYIDLSSVLNNSGDYVVLFASDGAIVDQYQYTSNPGKDKTIGRSPDGGSWITLDSISKGSSNGDSSSTPTPDPTSTPTPSPSTSTTTSSFTISNTPSNINAGQSFNVTVNLSLPNSANSDYYLKGAFKIKDGTRYLGLTKVGGEWIEYGDENTDQYKITTDSSGNWTGSLEVKADQSDKDYKGTGDYIFKVGRYTSGGSVTWSNEQTIHITDNSTPIPTATPKPSGAPTNVSSTKSATSIAISPSSTPKLPILGLSTTSAEASEEAYAANMQSKNFSGVIMIVGGLIIILTTVGVYLRYKSTHVQS